jgi:hypothetical protein
VIVLQFLFHHVLVVGFAAYWLFSAFVSGMPEPSPASSFAYHWLFASLNALAANIADVIRVRFPRAPVPEVPERNGGTIEKASQKSE